MSMSDQEDCPFRFGQRTSKFSGAVFHNDRIPSTASKYQSPNRTERRDTNPISARSQRSSLNQLSSRTYRREKDHLPPITQQSSCIISSSSDSSKICGRLNYPVFKPPCFEFTGKEQKSRPFAKDIRSVGDSDESGTNIDKKISPSGTVSNHTGSSPINFNFLYGKEGSRRASSPKFPGQVESESSISPGSSRNNVVENGTEINPNFRSFWNLTGMYQAGDSRTTDSLKVLSLNMPLSADGKSDADSVRDPGTMTLSARIRRRKEKGSNYCSTSNSQPACSSSTYSPCIQSPNPVSSASSPRSPFIIDLDTESPKSNETENVTQLQRALQEFNQREKKETNCSESIEDVLASYRSVNSKLSLDKCSYSRDRLRRQDEVVSYGELVTADEVITTLDVHIESSDMCVASKSNVITPTDLEPDEQSPADSLLSPSPQNKIESLPASSGALKKLHTSSHKRHLESIKLSESEIIQLHRHSSKKTEMHSIQKLDKSSSSKLISLKETNRNKPLVQSARYGGDCNPQLSIKKPEVLSAKFPPYWPEVRPQLTGRKGYSSGSNSRRSKSPSPWTCSDYCNPKLESRKKIKVPKFPKSEGNSSKMPCPLTSRSLQIQKIKPSTSVPCSNPHTLITQIERELGVYDLRLNLPPSPSPPTSAHGQETEADFYVDADPNWIRSEPFPGCVQYCPVGMPTAHQIVAQFQENRQGLSPYGSSNSSKQSKLSINSESEEDEISADPNIAEDSSQDGRNYVTFQTRKMDRPSLARSQSESSGSRNEQERVNKSSRYDVMSTRIEEYKLANTWFENEINGTGPGHYTGENWRDGIQFDSAKSPERAAQGIINSTPPAGSSRAPSHVSYESRDTAYVQDNLSLETLSENQGFCSWLRNLCSSLTKWITEIE